MSIAKSDATATALPTVRPASQDGPVKEPRFLNGLIGIGTGFLILIIWEIAGKEINPLFASYPTQIAAELWRMTTGGQLLPAILESMYPFLTAFVLSAAIGIPVGIALGRSLLFRAAFGNYIVAIYMMPVIALIPLYMLWFGLGFMVKVAIIFTMAIFPIIINTWDGVSAVPKTMIELGQTFLASRTQVVCKIVLPAAVPFIMTGLRLAVGRGIVAMVVAEFFTGVSGLGALIIMAGNQFNTAGLFGPVVVLMLIGVGLTQLVSFIENKVAPWQKSTSASK
ncbi:ABC transporter permease [Aurantimonas sp. C2-6-R+9]|uniref:ABC transporter permease n=1 Tax=unclassified Aurantimonas TaxID=2638230 RepID=UPI002E18B7B3|nr:MULTISPECIES: ABC transporter permease [unclassified Aurantimonas]MEC5293126.1 ABC transporter permease [Aurantimonas sp. C2-3-R2]MEC5383222.1 ABC transporter permease [Aurantimonas sp. C2-6-R+9]MEC5414206.1 ABC transporter permease [Aurantimonas sp. C2-4-R8]